LLILSLVKIGPLATISTTIFKDLTSIYFDYLLNWKEENTMLKVLYDTSTKATKIAADGMYCTIFSNTKPNVPSDKARYEKICHKFIDLCTPDNKWGLSLINEGKYAFDVKGDIIRLTMLRCCKYPDPSTESWVNKERELNKEKFNHEVPKFSELGPFECRYSLFPHKGGTLRKYNDSVNVSVKRKAEEFNNPIMIFPLERDLGKEQIRNYSSFVDILTPNVFLGAFKKEEWNEENAYILRFVEICGEPCEANIKFNSEFSSKINKVIAVDLLEQNFNDDFDWNKEEKSLKFKIDKFEIKTFKISVIIS
jgi:alpha-mannosidase